MKLTEGFNLLATAPDGIKRLRELILNLAVQGKLVPQDPSDEPASELLKQIRAEKQRLIAEGKIKKDKPLLAIGDDEKPFALPEGWEWVRLNDAYDVRDGTHDSPKYHLAGFPLVTSKNLYTGKLDLSDVKLISEADYLQIAVRSKVDRGDVLFAMIGSIGNPVLVDVDIEFAIKNVALFKYYSSSLSKPEYLLLLLKVAAVRLKADAAGGVQSFVSLGGLRKFLCALPPLAEQSRIVAKVEELMALCDALETRGQLEAEQHARLTATLFDALAASESAHQLQENWARLAASFDLVLDRPQAVDALEQTILQLAVRGLLVPQDPADEPASELLKQIRAEKDRLIAEGKIKKDKPLPAISDEEKPFDLPQGWEWSMLAEVGLISPRNTLPDETEVSFVQMSSIPVALFEPHLTETRKWKEVKSGFTHFAEGDVGVAKITPCFENGKSVVFCNLKNGFGAGTTELHVVRPLAGLNPNYVLIYLKTPSFLKGGEVGMTGSAGQKRLSRQFFEENPFPLPPLAEQSRIVARVEALRALCGQLRQRLAASRDTQGQLASALLAQG